MVGRTGAGKSALAAHLAQWARGQLEGLDDGKPICVLTHHVGCSVQSRSHVHFVRRALIALKATFGIEKEVPGDDQQLVRSFAEWMEIASERGYTLLVLDGVDKLNNATQYETHARNSYYRHLLLQLPAVYNAKHKMIDDFPDSIGTAPSSNCRTSLPSCSSPLGGGGSPYRSIRER